MNFYKRLRYTIATFFLTICLSPLSIFAATQEFRGIDVSKNNGTIDWLAVSNAGYEFVMIKTGNGKDIGNSADIDPLFEINYENAGTQGFSRGVYHMISGNTPAEAIAEAKYCLSIVDGRDLELPIAYDIETTLDLKDSALFQSGKENITNMAVAFCKTIEDAGYIPMIYTSSNIYNTYLDHSRLKNYRIWIAHHNVSAPKIDTPYQIWQYAMESVSGANTSSGKCDVNLATETLTLNQKTLTLGKGEKAQLKATLETPFADQSLIWKSSASSKAIISSKGLITAKNIGTSSIRAITSNNTQATCKITIKKAPTFIRFLSGKNTLKTKTLKKGQSYQVKTALSSGSASYKQTYTTGNKKIATVTATGKIKAVAIGTTTITVKTYNGKTARLKIIVKK